MSFDVAGQVAIVTGSNRGIGQAIVEELLQAGIAKVYAGMRRLQPVDELFPHAAGRVMAVPLDLQQNDTILAAAKMANDVNLVINNAGVLKVAGPLSPDAFAALDFEIDVNVKGLLRMAQAFAPTLKRNGGGAFVQINSVASMRSFADFSTYCASKAAAYSFTQALHDVLLEQGTLVMSVHPGPIATDMGDSAGLSAIAEPPRLVADAIVTGLRAGQYHVFPDSMAKKYQMGYGSFARAFVEATNRETS